MVLTVLNPPVGGRVGPGVIVELHTTLGPILNDDWYGINILDHATGNNLVYGDRISHGSLFENVIPGQSQKFAVSTFPPALEGVVDGGSVDIQAALSHANGVVIDSVLATGYHWDAVTGLWLIIIQASSTSQFGSALYTTYKNSP
jgi:hypothetical protein